MNDTAETSTQPAAKSTSETQPKWRAWRAFLVCQVWAFVLFLPVNMRIMTEHNRYYLNWDIGVLSSYFIATTVLGLVFFLLALALKRLMPNGYASLAGTVVVISLIFLVWGYVSKNYARHFFPVAISPLFVIFTIAVMALLHKKDIRIKKIQGWLSNAGLLLVFLVPIFWISSLTYTTYPKRTYPPLNELAKTKSSKDELLPADNVYVFIFDEWSYRLTFDKDGLPNNDFPNLRAFAQQACVFSDAHSPACHTLAALPRILFERTDQFVVHKGQLGFWKGNVFQPCLDQTSLFSKAKTRGYRTYMVGWMHPYSLMLGDQVDYCYSMVSIQQIGETPKQSIGVLYWDAFAQTAGPLFSGLFGLSEARLINSTHLHQIQKMFGKVETIFQEDNRKGQFAIFHVPLPHHPYLFTKEGKLRDLNSFRLANDPSLSREQTIFLDSLIGKLLEKLKARKKYENSLIVFSSDHTLRYDPGLQATASNYSHVPLLIHFPGQKENIQVSSKFSTSYLLPLLDAVAKSEKNLKDIDQIIGKNMWYFDVPQSEIYQRRIIVK